MALLDRKTLQEHINEKITNGHFICEESICRCFEKIKDELNYSILSHRWGSQELTFSEFRDLHEHATRGSRDSKSSPNAMASMKQLWWETPFKTSLAKLLEFQKVSAQRQCKYAWVDTICINKESSAELDESIRSMYAWYRDAHICVAHLGQTYHHIDMEEDQWFTRGWTLQELLAPKRIKFFSASWEEITHRENDKNLDSDEQQAAKGGTDNPPLWSTINNITGIPIEDLLEFKPGLYDIGQRMNWASQRTTTRVEDMAYCLIGIFQVNLSIAYGEKEGAFYRLQVEIMQNTEDQSLFKWKGQASAYNSMFARSPKCFSQALRHHANNTLPLGTKLTFTAVANFQRRISRIFYLKSEVPKLEIWKNLAGPTAFIILGPSSKAKSYIMILEQIGSDHCYKRVDVIEIKLEKQLLKKSPSEIFIK